MSFISLWFLLFVAVAIVLYYVFPKKHRWIVLLLASYFFYLINDLRAVVYIITTTVTVFLAGWGMKKLKDKQTSFFESQTPEWLAENKKAYQKKTNKKRKWILIGTLFINFGILFAVKYFATIADGFAELINVEPLRLKILLPLGISFYTFQAVGYLVDVYFNKIEPQTNLFKFALFTSFFPQLIQGPISRYDSLAPKLVDGNDFSFTKLKSGLLLMIWGYFKKMVIADRAFLLYSAVMSNWQNFQGLEIFVAMLCFVLQLYCDFSGGIDIARGVAECFGVDLAENFKRPFFALSMTEYWRRWHITLGAWMKDYVLYPLTMSRFYNKFIKFCRKTFKRGGGIAGKVIPSAVAMFFVFLLVGVWHGPNMTYLLFGVYNGVIILIETVFSEARKIKKIKPKQHNKFVSWLIKSSKWAVTFMLVFFGKYFSAAPNVSTVFTWYGATFKYHSFGMLFNNFLAKTGFNATNMSLLLIATALLIFVECMQEKGVQVREGILASKKIWQWVIFYVAIILVVLFAIYSNSAGGFAYEKF